jgi:outer membrane protein assembly factor BamB
VPRRLRFPLLLLAAAAAACAGDRPAPRAPVFAPPAAWKTLLGDAVVPPLATDGRRLFVATRDGALRALDPLTGALLWAAEGRPGHLAARDGLLFVRSEDGGVTSLQPRTGDERWRAETAVLGTLPVLADGDRVFVAGRGLAALALETGALLWKDDRKGEAGTETTAPPVVAGTQLLTGEQDGTLRSRDRTSGRTLWTLPTRGALLAPPLVDETRGKLYLGTTDRRILEVSLRDGKPGWSWRVGADIAYPGLLQPERVLFAPHDAVLHALARGGNLAWRAPLPSRPAGAPLQFEGRLLVACLENQVIALDARTGALAGSLRTPTEIRTPPLLVADHLVLGLRDRSVIAYALGAPPSTAEPVPPPPPPPPPPPVEPPPTDR